MISTVLELMSSIPYDSLITKSLIQCPVNIAQVRRITENQKKLRIDEGISS